jgi:hypothetical protein
VPVISVKKIKNASKADGELGKHITVSWNHAADAGEVLADGFQRVPVHPSLGFDRSHHAVP